MPPDSPRVTASGHGAGTASRRGLLVCLLLGTPVLAVQAGSQASAPLTVAAASDLQFAFTELGSRFERRTGRRVIFSFGSTGNLAMQIEHGAPFDLFFAANEEYVATLRAKGKVTAATVERYAVGRIVLALNRKSGHPVEDLRGLLGSQVTRVAIANPEHAPYGRAAREALEKAGIWAAVKPKLVFAENIRQALQFVQTGNADAGIVALSVARAPGITFVPIDERWHSPLVQAAAVVAGSPREPAAREFLRFVLSREGRAVMARYGFQPPPGNAPKRSPAR